MSAFVVFFGGQDASPSDMDKWLNSARGQQPNLEFSAFPWPHGEGQHRSAVTAIEASKADMVYLVGHSSGCAYANAVDKALKNTNKVVLVALDGFAPDSAQLKRASTQVWGAVCGKEKSFNYPYSVPKGNVRIYPATDCYSKWALHFSLVNEAATDSLVKTIKTGYEQCRANLCFLVV